MKPFARGLVVGKFSPLHRGHELVIRTALEQCERVYVLSYSRPELPGCDPERRSHWLLALFPEVRSLVLTDALLREQAHPELPEQLPHNDAPDLEHRRFVAAACRVFFATHVDAVFTSESYGPGFAEELTRYFRTTEPGAAAVRHVAVDPERRRVPISGTALRAGCARADDFLAPIVRASFVRRVLLLGGESSGKSTLARSLAQRFETELVAEYGRELWEARDGQLVYEDLLEIGREQIAREERALLTAQRFLFCDTSPLTTLFYCLDLFGRAEPELMAAATRGYDFIVLCAPDIPFEQDGTRRDAAFRAQQHAWYLAEIERRGTPWLLVQGDDPARVEQVVSRLLPT